MEFIFQILAQLLSPVEEEQGKAQVKELTKVEEKPETVVQAEKTEQEEPNLFGMMEFH